MFEHIVKPVPGSSAGTHRRLSAGAWVAGLVAAVLLGASAGAQAAGRTADAPAAFGSSTIDTLLAQARQRYHAAQAIFVVADAADGPRAELSTYAYEDGHWSRVMKPVPAVLGKHGTSLHRHEGDMKSPAGIFRMGRAFGSQPEPAGVSLPYTRTTRYVYWVDDVSSPEYNRWETYYGDADNRWKSYERLRIPAYEYAAVIEYNTHPIRKGAGSAIFFHIWPGPDGHTSGCTAVSKKHVLEVLRWLDPAKQPVIIQGSRDQLLTLARGGGRP